MQKMIKRHIMGRGKNHLISSGSQFRFIIFLILLLISYTVLLRVFQKIAEIVQLPIFLPIALITLLVFIGIVGILYSHTFVGPLMRIRRALEQISCGEMNVSLRLREADDPVLKELVTAITKLCENSRNFQALLQDTSRELSADIAVLQDKFSKGASHADIHRQMDAVRKKQELLEKAIKSLGMT
jgi:nitrogen fixation/metabolism regulation signal transduction histidine kinase